MDPELARYLDRNYWSQKATDDGKPSIGAQLAAMQPSAPVANTEQPKAATVSEVILLCFKCLVFRRTIN